MCQTINLILIFTYYHKSLSTTLLFWTEIAKSKYFLTFAFITNFEKCKYFKYNSSYEQNNIKVIISISKFSKCFTKKCVLYRVKGIRLKLRFFNLVECHCYPPTISSRTFSYRKYSFHYLVVVSVSFFIQDIYLYFLFVHMFLQRLDNVFSFLYSVQHAFHCLRSSIFFLHLPRYFPCRSLFTTTL